MRISVFDRVENILGKGEIACTSSFSFSTMFSKGFFPKLIKGVIVWEWVKAKPHSRQGSGKRSRAIMALLFFCLEQVYLSTKSSVVVKCMDCAV